MKFDAIYKIVTEKTAVDAVTDKSTWNDPKGPFKPEVEPAGDQTYKGPSKKVTDAAKKGGSLGPPLKSIYRKLFKEYTSKWLNENTNEGPDLRYVADLAKQNQTDIKMLVKALRDPNYIATMLKNAGKMITGGHGKKPQKNVVGSQVSKYEQEHPADLKHRLKGLFEKYRAGIKLL